MKRDRNGIPILGVLDPMEVRVQEVIAEKTNLADDAHDWQVIVAYAISDDEARRATDDTSQAQVPLMEETVAGVVGPVCAKCKQPYGIVGRDACTGDPFLAQFNSLTPEMAEDLKARLNERIAESKAVTVDDDGTQTYTTKGGPVTQSPIPGVH